MARWAVGSFTTASSVSTHSLNLGSITSGAAFFIAGSTGSPNTTLSGVAAISAGVGAQEAVNYGSWFNSSAKTSVSSALAAYSLRSTDDSVVLRSANVQSTQVVSSAAPPGGAAYWLAAGGDIQQKPAGVSVSTVASTQASTGYGFQPNAALFVGRSYASSVANFSFGFACQTSDGTIKQWCIDQSGREGALAQVTRSASSGSALSLHTTNTTAHDVSVTSFKADGLELTVNATDTARAAFVSILGLKVPRADAGKATITTNGVGVGQTGITVTGLGPNVGLVLLASIGSSLQTLQSDNMFSIGFASSNGNQRSVAGMVTQSAGASTRYASYFNSTRAVTFVSGSSNVHPSITAPPARVSQGLFAATSDGFTVTFDNTAANGWDIYWGAFSNIVSDIGGSIQSSFSAAAGPHEVQRIGAILGSSFNANAGIKEVDRIGASIGAVFSEALGLTPDFFPGEGKYHGHSHMDVALSKDASEGLGRGMYEELSERYRYDQENTSSPDLYKTLSVTTERQRLGVAEFGNAKFLRILAPSTNTVPLRLAAGRGGSGMLLGREMTVFTLADRGGSDVYLFTTVDGTTVPDVLVRIE